MRSLLRAEWLKISTTRGTWILIGVEVLLLAAAVSGSVVSGGFTAERMGSPAGVQELLAHGGLTAILSLVIGVSISAGEFRHGTVTDTFLTTPRRGWVVTAKIGIGVAVGAIIGVLNAVTITGTAAIWYAQKSVDFPFNSTVLAGAIGITGWHLLYTVIGVALGLLVTSPTFAVVGALAWFVIAETTIAQLLVSAGRWLPGVAGRAMGNDPTSGLLTPAIGAAVLFGWAALATAAATVTLDRRDLTGAG